LFKLDRHREPVPGWQTYRVAAGPELLSVALRQPEEPIPVRDTMLKLIHSDNLEYKELTAVAKVA
jgi:hypothetical protein